MMQQGISRSVFPGAVLLAAVGDEICFHRAYGHIDNQTHRPVTTETVFDLASLTKPLATTLAVVKLLQDQKLELDRPIGSILPPFNAPPRAAITIRHLLGHCSGLPDYRPYYRELRNLPAQKRRGTLRRLLAKEPLTTEPGKVVCYSDPGFMLLCWVVETVCGTRLDSYLQREVYGPLGIDLFFHPLDEPIPKREYAATENCSWRGRVLRGVVHDDNAYVVGGVEGHAGLFGTAAAINKLLTELLLTYSGKKAGGVFQRPWLTTIFRRQPDIDRALGFDSPDETESSCGKYFALSSVGHLGYTGTSFWMDLQKEVRLILLTNRVHPSRENEAIKSFRPEIHDRVMASLGYTGQ